MPLTDDIDHSEGLYEYLGANDESRWAKIKKALNRGTTPAEIKTGRPFVPFGSFDPERITFTGIEDEARVLPASWALSPQNPAAGFSNGFAYYVLPTGVTTDLYFTIELEEWWLGGTVAMFMEWTNLHSATGNVRWQFEFKECDIGTETLAQSDVVQSKTISIGSPNANGGTTTSICFSVDDGTPLTFNPGVLAAFYSMRITRLGGDVLDTVEGPVGFVSTNIVRGL